MLHNSVLFSGAQWFYVLALLSKVKLLVKEAKRYRIHGSGFFMTSVTSGPRALPRCPCIVSQ